MDRRVTVSTAAATVAVKQFAQDEAEQETVAAVLEAAGGDRHSTALQARPKLNRLRSLSGAESGRAFIDMQITRHEQLLQAPESHLAGGQDQTFRSIAPLAHGHIREHPGSLGQDPAGNRPSLPAVPLPKDFQPSWSVTAPSGRAGKPSSSRALLDGRGGPRDHGR